MNKTIFLSFMATGLIAVGTIAVPAFALSQTTTITSNDTNTQTNNQHAKLSATQTNSIIQFNAPSSNTNQNGTSSTQVSITNQNNAQSAAAANLLSQNISQSAFNAHFSSKTISSSQSAVCAIVNMTC